MRPDLGLGATSGRLSIPVYDEPATVPAMLATVAGRFSLRMVPS